MPRTCLDVFRAFVNQFVPSGFLTRMPTMTCRIQRLIRMTSKTLQGLRVNNFLCFELATARRFALDIHVKFFCCRLLVGQTRNPKCLVDHSFSHAVIRVDHNLARICNNYPYNHPICLIHVQGKTRSRGLINCISKLGIGQSGMLTGRFLTASIWINPI